ncbi:MAG TPA: alpha/beta hydrolase [Pyrinomonadaceae bacterium]|jgi:pimeloyl-ACP methyl ester carboxylesterase
MKKRYLIGGAYGLAGAALAAKLWRRPREVAWEEHGGSVRHAERSRFVEVDGVRVHYQEAGEPDAPTLILIHGFCASTFVWSDVLMPLAEMGFRVVAADLVGFGFSDKPGAGEYTIDWQARMIVGLMDALGIERAALIGSSYGGAVAATCALDYPSRVERLVLVGAVSNDEAKQQFLLQLAATPVMGDLVSPLVLSSPRLMRWRMSKVYAKGNAQLFEDERMRAHHLPLCSADTQRAVLRTLRRWNASRVEREAHTIEQPTLLVWGEEDRDVPLRHGERLHASMPNSRLVVFRRCGHLPQEEQPEEFAGLVAGFCRVVNRKS